MLACWFVSFSFYYFPNVVSYNFLATQLKPSLVIVEAVQSTGAGGFILASEVASTKLLQWRQILKACFTFTKQDSIEDHPAFSPNENINKLISDIVARVKDELFLEGIAVDKNEQIGRAHV